MPQPKNPFLRTFIPTLLIVLGIGFAIAVWRNSSKSATNTTPTQQAEAPASTTPAQPSSPITPDGTQPAQPATPPPTQTTDAAATPPQPTPSTPAQPIAGTFRAERVESTGPIPVLGSADAAGPYKLQLEFSPNGAGIDAIRLANHEENITTTDKVVVQSSTVSHLPEAPNYPPFAAVSIVITPQGGTSSLPIPLDGPVWAPVSGRPGAFQARILDDHDRPVLRIERVYLLSEGKSHFTIRQQMVNLSGAPISFFFFERGPVDLPGGPSGYGGDKRRVHFGYFMSADPSQMVLSNKFLIERPDLIKKDDPLVKPIWPTEKTKAYTLTWVGSTNRYFGAAVFPVIDNPAQGKALGWVQRVDRVVIPNTGFDTHSSTALELASNQFTLAAAGQPGDWADLSHNVYAGPLNRKELRQDPVTEAVGLPGLVVYNFGGMCASCTFEAVSNALLWILHALHDWLLKDWALAIIGLVLIVRTLLHPVTKWSQIRMARFGKQMAAVGPKQKALQDKYKADPKKLQEETAKLWREEGVSPLGMLGCIPMVLQMPIWIALYAVLYFSVELRHTGAFYGVFQNIQPRSWPTWQFLGDLAEPDRLLMFKSSFHVPLIGAVIGEINALNVLPLLLAVVFFIQQKYLTPPTSATLTPEQEFQQKLMKWMTVVLFPVFMYNAPSGLAIYFICNSTFAILESRYVRSHMDKYDLLNVDKMRAERQARSSVIDKRGPGAGGGAGRKETFLERLQRLAIEKQKEAERLRNQPRKKK
ncbi:MAG TPA: YidC/Oxa1 family insertase periplasmic-domain containing protein [Phycisphaerales bacterium]|nr:YidC/Oxa1 family insertase periplasmic-domain containing protein [Phycisphaerales bacterium]